MNSSHFLQTGSFLAIRTGASVFEMLANAAEMEDMPAVEAGNVIIEFL